MYEIVSEKLPFCLADRILNQLDIERGHRIVDWPVREAACGSPRADQPKDMFYEGLRR